MGKYKIRLTCNYNEIVLELTTPIIIIHSESVNRIANNVEVFLFEDTISLKEDLLDGKLPSINYYDKNLYQFQICTKDTKPVDPKKLSPDELKALIVNPDCMTGPEDYENVPWNIPQVYKALKQQYPKKTVFKFDCIAYGIDEINEKENNKCFICNIPLEHDDTEKTLKCPKCKKIYDAIEEREINLGLELKKEALLDGKVTTIESNENIVSIKIDTNKLLSIDVLVNNKYEFIEKLKFVLEGNDELVPNLILDAINDCKNLD
jgi:hypothetical protein